MCVFVRVSVCVCNFLVLTDQFSQSAGLVDIWLHLVVKPVVCIEFLKHCVQQILLYLLIRMTHTQTYQSTLSCTCFLKGAMKQSLFLLFSLLNNIYLLIAISEDDGHLRPDLDVTAVILDLLEI